MLAFIELTYDALQKVKELPREEYLKFRDNFRSFHLPDWPEGGEIPKYIYPSEEILIDIATDGPYLNSLNMEFTIKRFKGAYFTDSNIHRRTSSLSPSEQAGVTNIQIAIPDLALLSITEVMVEEDVCTDQLQDRLNDGWRIIAICPPNCQRRPDYILARYRGVGR